MINSISKASKLYMTLKVILDPILPNFDFIGFVISAVDSERL